MSKLIWVTLFLVLLAVIWCDQTVHSRRWPNMDRGIKECKCKVLPNDKLSCPKYLFRVSLEERLKCLCNKHYHVPSKMYSAKFQRVCRKLFEDWSIPLPLT